MIVEVNGDRIYRGPEGERRRWRRDGPSPPVDVPAGAAGIRGELRWAPTVKEPSTGGIFPFAAIDAKMKRLEAEKTVIRLAAREAGDYGSSAV